MRIRALAAEFIGTFMLVASVLGAALFSFPIAGIVGVALSIGFSVMAMIFAHLASSMTLNAGHGALVGFMCWLGFAATSSYATALFSGKPKQLWLIDSTYNLVSFVLAGLLIVQLTSALMAVNEYNTPVGAQSDATTVNSVADMGRAIFTRHTFAFEATSILILVAMVGAVVLARREGEQ